MRIACFSSKPYAEAFFGPAATAVRHEVMLAQGAEVVCAFVNDDLGAEPREGSADAGVRLVALRAAGFNNVDLDAAKRLGIAVGRAPACSPHPVAEHTMALIRTRVPRIHRACNRASAGDFELDGPMGFDLHAKTAAVVATGKTGQVLARILQGVGCEVIAFDPSPNKGFVAAGMRYGGQPEHLAAADLIALQCPLAPGTHRPIDAEAVAAMKEGAVIMNTSRAAVVETRAVIRGPKSGRIGALALDIYEGKGDFVFGGLSDRIISDDVFARLLTFPGALVSGQQGVFTREALTGIAETTIADIMADEKDHAPLHPAQP